MRTQVAYPIALICAFTWIGFVCAISFMEAWLKFRAHGVSLPIGLGIGRLVFNALNKVEWVLALAIAIDLVRNMPMPRNLVPIGIAIVLLVVQTFWLLPALDERALLVIHGQGAAPSNLHFVYVAFEVIKVTCLIVFGIMLFNSEPTLARATN